MQTLFLTFLDSATLNQWFRGLSKPHAFYLPASRPGCGTRSLDTSALSSSLIRDWHSIRELLGSSTTTASSLNHGDRFLEPTCNRPGPDSMLVPSTGTATWYFAKAIDFIESQVYCKARSKFDDTRQDLPLPDIVYLPTNGGQPTAKFLPQPAPHPWSPNWRRSSCS